MRHNCLLCSYVYDEEIGVPEEGIPPGTKFEDLPDDWCCPDCGVDKSQFEEDSEDDSNNKDTIP